MLEERGSGQDDVGIVGGIGEELLVHDGEQIRTPQSADHRVDWDRPPPDSSLDKERFDRRIFPKCSAPCSTMFTVPVERPTAFSMKLVHSNASSIQPESAAGGELQPAANFFP
jgi:hypothetical protein